LETNFKNKFPSIRKVFDVDEKSSNNKKSRGAIPNEHCCWIQEIISQVISGAIRVTPTTGEEIAHFNLAMLKESSHSTVPISSSRDANSNNVYSPRSPQSHKDAKQQNSQHLQAGMNSEINSQKPTNCNVDPEVQE